MGCLLPGFEKAGRTSPKIVSCIGMLASIISGRVTANFCIYYTKNLGVRLIMETMCTVYAKNGTRSQHVSNYSTGKRSQKAREYCERKACIVCKEHFISLNLLMNPVVKVLLKCVICFSISFHQYAFWNFCTQISRPLTCLRCTHLLKS